MEKFDEYWSGKFSFEASLVTREPKLLVGKIPVEVAFSPSDRVRKKILEELDFVKERLDIMAFSLTSDEIAGKLKDLAKRGVGKLNGIVLVEGRVVVLAPTVANYQYNGPLYSVDF